MNFFHRYTQAHEKEESSEAEEPKVTIKMTLSARLEAIEQKLSKLQYLKDETLDEFSSLLNECNFNGKYTKKMEID